MALKSITSWTYFNEANPSEKIVVQDRHSAQVLGEVLKNHKDVWELKEEYAQNTHTPAPVQAAPVASTVVADVPKPTAPKLQDLAPAARVAAPAASAVSAAMAAEVTAARILIQKAIPIEPEFEEHFDDEEVEAMAPAQAKAKTPMPPPLKTQTKTQYKPPARTEERRAQKRFNVDLRIILISKGRSFRSISQDVSLGGMKLKNKVPQEFSGEECMAYISTADARENIEMVCQVIPDPSDPRRVQFLEADTQQLKRLSKWLVENDSVKKAG